MPSLDLLLKCASKNQDGYGFASSKGKFFRSLNFESFINHLDMVSSSELCILHMRDATSAPVFLDNCHPFYDKETNVWFAHNGDIEINNSEDKTDSETIFREIFIPIIRNYGIESGEFETICNQYIQNSKFVFLQKEKFYTYGTFLQMGDCLYSNLNWLEQNEK